MARPTRAEPLAPAARRLKIIEAALPLLIKHGATVTTRELAKAAGIAEGTLFGVFPDKPALIRAAIEHSFDPEPVSARLAAINSSLTLEAQLLEAARITQSFSAEATALLGVLRTLPARDAPNGPPAFISVWSEAVIRGVAALLEPHAERLRLESSQVASVLLGMMFARQRSLAPPGKQLSLEQTIGILLHGALAEATDRGNACS